MGLDLGITTGTDEILTTSDTDSADDINSSVAADAPEVAALKTAKAIWLNATPGVAWNTLTGGRWSIVVVYIDYESMHTE